MTDFIRKRSTLLNTAGLVTALIVLPSCAVSARDGYYYDQYDQYGYDQYGDPYDASDTLHLEDRRSQYGQHGIDGARRAHAVNAEYRAERLDGNCESVVTVRRGDTLSDIAEYCDVPVRALLEANYLRSAHLIEVGQQIRVPAVKGNVYEGIAFHSPYAQRARVTQRYDSNPAAYPTPVRYDDRNDHERKAHRHPHREDVVYYTARRGDGLEDISERFRVSERTIISLNPHLLDDDVDTGDRIALPEEVVRYTQDSNWQDRRDHQYRSDWQDDRRVRYEPAIRLSQQTVGFNDDVEIIVEDLPPRSDIVLSFGSSPNRMHDYHRASADQYGRYRHNISFDRNDFNRDKVIIGVRTDDDRYKVYSKPIRYTRQYTQLQ